MTPSIKDRAYKRDMLFAGALITAGIVISGMSLAQLATVKNHEMAQATQPLQSTPGAETKPSAPQEPTTSGARPLDVAPQPARPDADAQQSGDRPALPPAPAEKTGEPIQTK